MALSPMMQQYQKIKEEYNDCLVMFRLGDFYELFFDDAITASRELELTLTGRNCGLEERAPMCGVPHHAVDSYLARLVRAGYKVAICEQLEDPAEATGIVERGVTRIVTPGTLDLLDSSDVNDNIYIASIYIDDLHCGLAFADITTGEFWGEEFGDDLSYSKLQTELSRYSPREIISSNEYQDTIKELSRKSGIKAYISTFEAPYYRKDACEQALMKLYKVSAMISLGLSDNDGIVLSAGSLVMYLIDTQKQDPSQLSEIKIKNINNSMQLDRSTMRNLELLETMYTNDVHGSLFGVLNKTKTAMGARLLKSFLKEPLKDSEAINLRLNAVEEIKNNPLLLNNFFNSLKNVYDFQRLSARIASKRANAKDLIALKNTLAELPDIKEHLSYLDSKLCGEIRDDIDDFSEITSKIERAIVEDPPFVITDGGIIKKHYSEELDEIKASIADAKEWIAGLEKTERERTGIKTIKVGFNKVFGYYIDVSKSMIDKVPEEYIRKQTLVNNERYITPELKEKESLVLSAESKINTLEYELFKDLRESIEPYIGRLQKASSAIALLDVLCSFAKVASDNNYVKPVVDDSDVIDIAKGRHPTVEKSIGTGMFVANDTKINGSDRSMLIITGPNMAGKSTYMRQTAIIVIMAQIGCFVPCDSARIGVVDRVFTRIGASDNLAFGQSTFFIEMSELANILRNATTRSLVILDEIGRGTSTFDGLSIAWATVKYLCKGDRMIRTMFATHYHELTTLEEQLPSVCNLSVAVAEEDSNIIFLHNIVEGPASKSYGIHVAKIAGVPQEIQQNAISKLRELESYSDSNSNYNSRNNSNNNGNNNISDNNNSRIEGGEQLSLLREIQNLSEDKYSSVIENIKNIDVNTLTPLEAMNALSDIIKQVKTIGENDD